MELINYKINHKDVDYISTQEQNQQIYFQF